MKKISVIIPVYNHAHTIMKSLDSLFAQTHRPLEIVVVNDGSTDNYKEAKKKIQLEYCNKEENIDILFIEQVNSGAPSARNRGFRACSGDFVIFWDADIIGQSDMLERMYIALEQATDCSYAYSQFRFGFKKIKSAPFSADTLKKNNYISTMSLIRRKDVVPFDESLKRFQDWDMWLTMLGQKKIGIFIPFVLFRVITGFRSGISSWLPSFVYKLPFRMWGVKKYDELKKIVVAKHRLG